MKNPLQELSRGLIASHENRSAARQHHRRDNGTIDPRQNMSAMEDAVTSPDVVSLILSRWRLPKTLLSAGTTCKLWHRVSRQQHIWRCLCEKRFPDVAGRIATQDFRGLFKRLYQATRQLPPQTPARLSDCMLILKTGVGPIQSNGKPARKVTLAFDLQNTNEVTWGQLRVYPPALEDDRARNNDYYLETESAVQDAFSFSVPGITSFFASCFTAEGQDILSANGFDDSCDMYLRAVSLTLVSKLNGSVVRLSTSISSCGPCNFTAEVPFRPTFRFSLDGPVLGSNIVSMHFCVGAGDRVFLKFHGAGGPHENVNPIFYSAEAIRDLLHGLWWEN